MIIIEANNIDQGDHEMTLDNANPHAHKSYELKEGLNGQGKCIYLVNTLVNGSIVWAEEFISKGEAECWLKYSCA